MKNQNLARLAVALCASTIFPVAAGDAPAPAGQPLSVALHSATPSPANEPASGAAPLVLTAPPRDSAAEGQTRFGPLAEFLSRVLGRKVEYRHPTTWSGYQIDMQRGVYDLVFDGPHFNGWRVDRLGHQVLVKLPGEFTQSVVVRRQNTGITSLKQLAGHKICAHAPPNLGTLIMYNEFDNPLRQPVIIVKDGYDHIYQALLAGQCEAAVLPLGHVQKQDPRGERTRIVYRSRALPQQAFSAGPRLSVAERTKIALALLSPQAATPLAGLRDTYGLGQGFVAANSGEYAGLGEYLKNVWGYY